MSKYMETDEVIGYLYRQNPMFIKNMKIGDELAVVMDNGVVVIKLDQREEDSAGLMVSRLHSVKVEGKIRFDNDKIVKMPKHPKAVKPE